MNALELADWIENGAPFGKYETAKQAVIMLRQQQAEIEVLKAKTLTEPSVKEITDLWLDVINNIPANDKRPREWHFARAILKKASEK